MSDSRVSRQAWRVGVGFGVVGALVVALKYALRSPTKRRVPDAISPAVFATKVLHTGLGEVLYHESGTGDPLIFVHDIFRGGSSYEWSKVYPQFASGHRVIALDLVGFGESSRPDRRFTAADYVRMLAEFSRALHWGKPPIFVGSGLGAGLCVLLASQHPNLVSRLVLHRPHGDGEGGTAPLPLANRLLYRTPLLARFVYRNHLSTRAAVAHWLARVGSSDPSWITEETIDVFTTCAQQPGAEHAVLSWLSGSLAFDFPKAMQACECKVTLLAETSPLAALRSPGAMADGIATALAS